MRPGDLSRKARESIGKHGMLAGNERIIIALSGGADSVALLLLFTELRAEYNLTLYAVHINHCIRGAEADADEEFCRALCGRYGIGLSCFREDIRAFAAENGVTLEEAGRIRRYELFESERIRLSADRIALAHNKNDNAETLLHRIIRGTGSKGLCGIPPVRDSIIRPLLDRGRDEIESYLLSKGETFRTDSTNLENDYTRNKIRNMLIPFVEKELNPDIINVLARLAVMSVEQESYIGDKTLRAYEDIACGNNGMPRLSVSRLLGYEPYMSARVIRLAILKSAERLKDISYAHVKDVMALCGKATGKGINLPYGLYVYRNYDELCFTASEEKCLPADSEIPCVLEKSVSIDGGRIYLMISKRKKNFPSAGLLCTKVFDYDKIISDIVVRHRRNGDMFTKKLKDYFIDKKIPRSDRDGFLLLCSGSDVLLIPYGNKAFSYPSNKRFEAGDNTDNKLYVYIYRPDKIGEGAL